MSTAELPSPVVERYVRRMQHTIRPSDIVLRDGGLAPASSFGKSQTEQAAGNLIRFFKAKGYWAEFEPAEFKEFCIENGLWNRDGHDDQLFFGLTGAWFDSGIMDARWTGSRFIILQPNGKCCVTQEFIQRCVGKKEAAKQKPSAPAKNAGARRKK